MGLVPSRGQAGACPADAAVVTCQRCLRGDSSQIPSLSVSAPKLGLSCSINSVKISFLCFRMSVGNPEIWHMEVRALGAGAEICSWVHH